MIISIESCERSSLEVDLEPKLNTGVSNIKCDAEACRDDNQLDLRFGLILMNRENRMSRGRIEAIEDSVVNVKMSDEEIMRSGCRKKEYGGSGERVFEVLPLEQVNVCDECRNDGGGEVE